jgi:predicted nucleotidyltransferase
MALSKDEVIKIAIGFLDLIRKNYDVRQAYLFGSFAKGVAKDYSDVDLAIILGSQEVSGESPFDEKFKIFHEGQKYNSLLEVVCLGQVRKSLTKMGGAWSCRLKKKALD